jgi:hypothetical protein
LRDPNIERRFYDELAARGKLLYRGGTPVILVSREETTKILNEVTAKVSGATMTHALNLEFEHKGYGMLGSLSAGVKNMPL